MWSQSFLPQVRPDTRVLIVGSMPGRISLASEQYYAHPRNAFWPIIECLFGIDARAPYVYRLEALNACYAGLWDVYAECYREGSLDADINNTNARYNDFARLFTEYSSIHSVFFNGQTAEKIFRRHLLPQLSGNVPQLYSLPSTSPAYAGMTFAEKLQRWKQLCEVIEHE